ncbi:MAG: hypothetical protein WAQ12_08815 [Tissierellaceae bacterium]|jgi:hypothetical protein
MVSLVNHLTHLKEEKLRIEILIKNVRKTIQSLKGETMMTDKERFEGFKKELIEKNEDKYGDEARERYGL